VATSQFSCCFDAISRFFLIGLLQALVAFLLVFFAIATFLHFKPSARTGEKHKRLGARSAGV
jgi:hypothetical protein